MATHESEASLGYRKPISKAGGKDKSSFRKEDLVSTTTTSRELKQGVEMENAAMKHQDVLFTETLAI